MTNLSRRSFLIGTAAVIAAAKLPLIPTPAPVLKSFPLKYVTDFTFMPGANQTVDADGIGFSLFRKTAESESTLIEGAAGRHGVIRWVAGPMDELIFPQGHLLGVNVFPEMASANMQVVSYIDGPGGGVDTVMPGHYADVYEDIDDDDVRVVGKEWVKEFTYKRRRAIVENFAWSDGKLIKNYISAMDVRDIELTT